MNAVNASKTNQSLGLILECTHILLEWCVEGKMENVDFFTEFLPVLLTKKIMSEKDRKHDRSAQKYHGVKVQVSVTSLCI